MAQNELPAIEETLDPEEWESMQLLGQRMVADMVNYTNTIRERPVWKHAPEEVKAHFNKPLPLEPQAPEEVYAEFLEYILPYPVGNIHPRFWGWVFGTGTIFGAFADLLASCMNTNTGGLDHHSANHVEKQVIEWFKEMLGFPASASGLLTSGCSAANLIGLAVGLNKMAGFDLRKHGIGASPQRMIVYTSTEIHSSVQKAVELLNLGSDSLRYIPVNEYFQIELAALKEAISKDREDGNKPFCIVAGAGTTNTGSIDDLDSLADVCQEEELWLHIDGAFGAWAALAPGVRDRVRGMERADSLALDLHKWMYMPYEIGCVLVKHEEDHRKTFTLTPDYLKHGEGERGMTGGDLTWFSDYGFQLSREFRALKAWMLLKQHGTRKYGRLIQQNVDQANYLADQIESTPELELMAPVMLNVVCFRYSEEGLDGATLDDVNKQIVVELQEQGIAATSGTIINGKYVIHIAHTNHRSRREDFDILVREVIRIGKKSVRL
jgi:aromatic-L-amino-acid decarboxylase